MRLHVAGDIDRSHIYRAVEFATRESGTGRVDIVKCERSGSRSHAHAFDVALEGDGSVQRHRPNSGASGAGGGYAAHWDAWGYFLGFLYDLDPTMKTGADRDRAAFDARTSNRFRVVNRALVAA